MGARLRSAIVVGVLVGLGAAGAAAQVIEDPTGNVAVGTTPSDHPDAATVAVARGGCANAGALAVGTGGCAPTGMVSVGVGGSGARGDIVVADRGDASTYPCSFICVPPRVAVTGGDGTAGCTGATAVAVNAGNGSACGGTLAYAGSGSAWAGYVAVSPSGTTAGEVAVSGTNTAGSCYGAVAVSVTGNACADTVAVSGLGNATAPVAVDLQ